MKKVLKNLWKLAGRYKYLIAIVGGILWVSMFDENSWREQMKLQNEINQLMEVYQESARKNDADSILLDQLKRDPKAYEKVAREQYYMKADDEDVFVLSDDSF